MKFILKGEAEFFMRWMIVVSNSSFMTESGLHVMPFSRKRSATWRNVDTFENNSLEE